MTDAERIRHLRLSLGMTLTHLANQAGVDREVARRAETGEGRPVRPALAARILETLERIARESGVDTSDDTPNLESVIFGVLADYTSDMDWIDEAGARLAAALRESGLLR